jgi:hypothetical protein
VSAPQAFATREEWAQAFLAHPATRDAFAAVGYPLPANIRVGIGWPSKGMRAKAIGECYSPTASGDGAHEIIVSPKLEGAALIVSTLVHEAAHAAVGVRCGHKGPFLKLARALGHTGRATVVFGGPAFTAWTAPIIDALGPFPHARLSDSISSGPKKQTTRQLKFECVACGIIGRMPRKGLERGVPFCGCCGERMTCDAIDSGDGGEDDDE